MNKLHGESLDTPETTQQAVIRLLEKRLTPYEWSSEWSKHRDGLSLLGNGRIREHKFIWGVYDDPSYIEYRVTRYKHNQPVATESHTICVETEVGQDSEGRTSTLNTDYTVDLLSGKLDVTQRIPTSASSERAASYPHFGINNAQPEDQWRQLRELIDLDTQNRF